MIRDRNIDWARKRVFVGANCLATLISSATGPITADAGASTVAEIGTSGIGGIKCTATGDIAQDFFPVPVDMDVSKKTYWRVWWTSDTAATTKTFTATMKYKNIGTGTAIAVGATALNTAIASDTSPGANKLAKTAWGVMNANKLTEGGFVSVKLQAAGTCATKTLWIIGYEYEYTPLKASKTESRKLVEAVRRVS